MAKLLILGIIILQLAVSPVFGGDISVGDLCGQSKVTDSSEGTSDDLGHCGCQHAGERIQLSSIGFILDTSPAGVLPIENESSLSYTPNPLLQPPTQA